MKIWRLLWLLLALSVIGASGYTLWHSWKNQVGEALPTAPARSGEFLVIVRSRGELKARRSVQVFAPKNVPDLRINWLVQSGNAVKEGDVVVRFDPSSARQQLQEREASLKQAQAALDTAIAQSTIISEQDFINSAKAR
jgi:HlyD family secretion protein